MDPLLKKLELASLGLKINDLFVGGFAHADDIRTITTVLQANDTHVKREYKSMPSYSQLIN